MQKYEKTIKQRVVCRKKSLSRERFPLFCVCNNEAEWDCAITERLKTFNHKKTE